MQEKLKGEIPVFDSRALLRPDVGGRGRRGAGLVRNADGSETARARKGDVVYEITIRKGQCPVMRY